MVTIALTFIVTTKLQNPQFDRFALQVARNYQLTCIFFASGDFRKLPEVITLGTDFLIIAVDLFDKYLVI